MNGTLPSLGSLTALRTFSIQYQDMGGPIPALAGLSQLESFSLNNNHFTGTLPSLTGLTSLRFFSVSHNELVGPIPSLDGLTALQAFGVQSNRLSGPPPVPPASLAAGGSSLCPNLLHPSSPDDAAWDTATGATPWAFTCTRGYLVSTSAGTGGSISPPQGVQAGQTATLTLTPDSNYEISSVTTSGCTGGTLDANAGTYTTGAVNADCYVSAWFRAAAGTIVPSVFWSPSLSGSASCTPAQPGQASTCVASPAAGFRLVDIEGCDGALATTSPYTTGPLQAACTVTVRFEAITTPAIAPVPTLGQWALVALGLLVSGLGMRRMPQRGQ
ncbi:IPTL-CTERM sorting domain-containing protein [Acidovorax sp. SDU_ACID1]|uniref:IPTL-CTERM sorting domain-containing protein n=1 Tax=Acidovorax sp. SDU_ACID1 TaxID=3136632 RepID=UPI0038731E4F